MNPVERLARFTVLEHLFASSLQYDVIASAIAFLNFSSFGLFHWKVMQNNRSVKDPVKTKADLAIVPASHLGCIEVLYRDVNSVHCFILVWFLWCGGWRWWRRLLSFLETLKQTTLTSKHDTEMDYQSFDSSKYVPMFDKELQKLLFTGTLLESGIPVQSFIALAFVRAICVHTWQGRVRAIERPLNAFIDI